MKKTFGIYLCGFKDNDNEIKPGITFVNGEVDMSSDEYKGLTTEQACRKRLAAEYDGKNTNGIHKSNNLDWDTFRFREVEDEITKGADKKLHKFYVEKKGIQQLLDSKTGGKTEEFDFGPNAEQIMDEAIAYYFGPMKEEPLDLRPVQINCIDKMKKALKDHSDFLVSIICRKGKTVAALNFCAENKFKNILFITAKCDALKSAYDDWRKFFCERYAFILKEDIKNRKIQNDERKKIVAVSMQSSAIDLHDDDDNGENEDAKIDVDKNIDNVSLLNELGKYAWDAIIIDECHFGIDTERSQETLKKLLKNSPHCFKIEMSATPFKKLKNGEYTNDNTFIYDNYSESIDPDNAKAKTDHNYSEFVPIVNYHLNLFDWMKNGKIADLRGNGKKSVKNKKEFQEKITERIKEWETPFNNFVFSWDSFFSDSAGFDEDSICSMFEKLYECIFKKYAENARTFAIYVNKIKHGEKLANALNRKKFNVFNVCGSNNRKSVHDIDNQFEKSVNDINEKPTIMISCSRYLTASTLKYLDCFIFMGTCNSPENFIQYESRAKNTREGRKCPCYVFDLNPETILTSQSFLDDLFIPKAKYEKKPFGQILQELYDKDCFEIYEMLTENDIKKIDVTKDFNEKFYKNGIFKNEKLIKDIIGADKLKEMSLFINLHDLISNVSAEGKSKLSTTLQQTNGKPKKEKPKKEHEKKERNTYISDFDKFLTVCNQTVLMMHTYDLTDIENIMKSTTNINAWYIHTLVDPILFDRIKDWSKEDDDNYTWDNFRSWFADETKRLISAF